MKGVMCLVAVFFILLISTSMVCGFADKLRNKAPSTRLKAAVRSDEELKTGIAGFYDQSSAIWLDVWGDHMHHGQSFPPTSPPHTFHKHIVIFTFFLMIYIYIRLLSHARL